MKIFLAFVFYLLICAGAFGQTSLSFNTTQGTASVVSSKWTATVAPWTGLSPTTMPLGSDWYVQFTILDAGDFSKGYLFINHTNSNTTLGQNGADLYIQQFGNTLIYRDGVGGGEVGFSCSTNDIIRVNKTSTTIKIQQSTNGGSSFTDMATLAHLSPSSNQFVYCNDLTTAKTVDVSQYNIGAVNQPPTVTIMNDTTIFTPSTTDSLISSATDPNVGGSISSYAWSQLVGPAATITNAAVARTKVTGLVVGSYTFQVVVFNNLGLSTTKQVNITVATPIPPSGNLTFTATPFSNPETRQQDRGFTMWQGGEGIDIPTEGAPTSDYDYYWRFCWADVENLNNDQFNWTYFDTKVQQAVSAGKRFNFGIFALYPGGYTGSVANATGTQAILGGTLSYPVSLHNLLQAEPVNKDYLGHTGNYPDYNSWMINYNSVNTRARFNRLKDSCIYHLKHTTYSGKNGWSAVGYWEVRDYGNTGEWTAYNNASRPSDAPASIVAADTTILNFANDAISRIPDKRLVIPVGGFLGSSIGDAAVNSATGYALMQLTNNVGFIGVRRDCFAQTDAFIPSFFENNTSTFNGFQFNQFFLNLYKTRPWYNEPCSCCALLNGSPNMYLDAPRQARLYHVAQVGNGNYFLPGTTAQVNQSKDSIRSASKFAGYRIGLTGGNITTSIPQNTNLTIALNYQNVGLTPPYYHWIPKYILKQGTTTKATFTSTHNDLYLFQPGTPAAVNDTFNIGTLAPGFYDVYLRIDDSTGWWPPFILSNTLTRQTDGSYLIASGIIVSSGVNKSVVIGTGSGTVSLTSMTGLNPGDTAFIAPGTYTSITLRDLKDIFVTAQDTINRPVFTTQSSMCRLVRDNISYMNFVSAGGATAIDLNCGRTDSTVFHNMNFQGWSGTVLNAGTDYAYTPGNDTTYKWLRDKFDSMKFFHCGKPFQVAFGVSPINANICRRDTFSRIVIEATTAASSEGIMYSGVCYGCVADNIKYTATTGRGPSGDNGMINGAGWWLIRNSYQSGSPARFTRIFPMMELNDTGTTQAYNNIRVNCQAYGMFNIQAQMQDSIHGQRICNGGIFYNNTLGNQFNDTLNLGNYWSPEFDFGQVAPNMHYYVSNNFAFNVGNNPQKVQFGGQPNNGKPQMCVNLGGWNTIGGDTSHNKYWTYATTAKLDSATTLFINSLGSFNGYYLTAASPLLLNAGITNQLTTKDFLGAPMRVPPDLGYIQLFNSINNIVIPGLRKGGKKLFILR